MTVKPNKSVAEMVGWSIFINCIRCAGLPAWCWIIFIDRFAHYLYNTVCFSTGAGDL